MTAAEFVRRAERGLGVAIREGQERGDVLRKGQRVDRLQSRQENRDTVISRPTDYAQPHELSGEPQGFGIYGMTDGVSDEQFEEAVTEARDEGNLSRANVAHKCKAESRPIDPEGSMRLLGRVLRGVAMLPGAKCRGRHHLFDPAGRHECDEVVAARHDQAIGLCQTCPVLDACRQWIERTPSRHRPAGVVAGQIIGGGR